jgi:type VI protein secretion system component VasA
MVLTFMDLDFNPRVPDVQVVYAQTLCTNGRLAQLLPPGARLLIEQAVPVRLITCLDKPTPQATLARDDAALWRLVSQLSLNHLSLTEEDSFAMEEGFRRELDANIVSTEMRAIFSRHGVSLSPHLRVVAHREEGHARARTWTIEDQDSNRVFTVVEEATQLAVSGDQQSLAALRALLQLYAMQDDFTARRQLQGIVAMTCRRVMRRVVQDPWGGFARGFEISLTFDADYYEGQSPFLLAMVLNHFFSLYVAANMFTQLVVKKKDSRGEWKRWAPMAGGQAVL